MTAVYDIAVIGGGPAGCSAAITAKRDGAHVLLLERGKFPRSKVCGEFVSSEALSLLRDLLRDSELSMVQSAPRIAVARVFIDGRVVNAAIDPPASSIPRFEMDPALWHAAEELGVDARAQSPVQSIEGDGPFTIHTSDATYAARSVVNASGRWSNLRSAAEAVSIGPKWIGVKAHFFETSPAPSVDLYFFPGGYCGVQPVSESEVNVCAMAQADVATSLEKVFQQEPRLLHRSGGWKQSGEVVFTSPLIFKQSSALNGNVLLAGDAAGFIDPFVGDGISMALHSGRLAASSLISFMSGSRTLENVARIYAAEYEARLLPAFRNAARARQIVSAPRLLRKAALGLMRFPGLSEFIVKQTRARII